MTDVKFIQIGATSLLVWSDTAAEGSYNALRNKALRDYPTAIIFGLYIKTVGSTKYYYELWANGKEYKIGGSGEVTAFTGTVEPWEYFKDSEDAPVLGNYYIKTKNGFKTAYVLVGDDYTAQASWAALNGNVNAENVYFPYGFERTLAWGTAPAKAEPSTDAEIVNKNLKEIFEFYLVKETWPTTVVTHEGALSTTDLFAVHDSGCTLTVNVKINDSTKSAISNNAYVLYGDEIEASGTYKPKLVKTNSTSLTYTNSSITGMTFGYGTSQNSGQTSTNTAIIKDSIIRYVTDNSTATLGNTSSILQYDTDLNSKNKASGTESDSDLSTTLTISKPSIGKHSIYLTNTNDASWSRTFYTDASKTMPTTEAIKTDAISSTYYCSNKKNTDADHVKSVASKSITLPASTARCTPSSAALSFTVYYPVYGNYKDSSKVIKAGSTSFLEVGKITENSLIITWTTPSDAANTDGNYVIKYPSSYKATATIDSGAMTEGIHYTLTTENIELGKDAKGANAINYTVLTIDGTKYSGAVTFKITLNKQ